MSGYGMELFFAAGYGIRLKLMAGCGMKKCDGMRDWVFFLDVIRDKFRVLLHVMCPVTTFVLSSLLVVTYEVAISYSFTLRYMQYIIFLFLLLFKTTNLFSV